MKLQVIKNRILFWGKKIFLYAIFTLFSFFTLGFLVLQFPQVQTALISRYLSGFSQVVGFPTTVEKIHLRWYDRLELQHVKIKDSENNSMIEVARLLVNFDILSLLQGGKVVLDDADLDGAKVSLFKISDSDTSKSLNINLFIKKINDKYSSSKVGQSSAKLDIQKVEIKRSQFLYNDNTKDSIKNGFDYYHFHLDVPEGHVSNFQIIGDTLQLNVKNINVLDHQTQLLVKKLSTYFRVSQRSMEFLNLDLNIGKSVVSDTIIFRYQSTDDLADFNEKVNIKAKFRSTIIDGNDLTHFTYGLLPLPFTTHLSGVLNGKVSKFIFTNMNLAWGNSKIAGRVSMDGLPTLNETFIDLKINDAIVDQNDIHFLLAEKSFNVLKPLGRTGLHGEFTGFINDFVAKGSLNTRLGKIDSDVNLKIDETDVDESTFSGRMELKDFQLGTYFNDTVNYQRVTLNGKINGKGLTRENTDFTLSGTINSLGFRKYNYTHIQTNARFARQLFNGDLSINDPNLVFNAKAFIDFRKGKELIQVKANLDTVFLDRLGFIKSPLFIRSYFEVNTSGLELDSLYGNVVLRHALMRYNDKSLVLDSIRLISSRDGNHRQLELQSSLADFLLKGDYRYSSLFNNIEQFGREFYLKLRNDHAALTTHYQKKKFAIVPYQAAFEITVHNLLPLAELARIDFFISPGATMKGNFVNDRESSLHFISKLDSVSFSGKFFLGNEIEFTGNKSQDSSLLKASVIVHSAHQQLSSLLKSKNTSAKIDWEGSHIKLNLAADQEGNNNILRLNSELDFLQDSIRIKVLPTQLRIFNEEWIFDQQNYSLMKGREWHIHQLRVNRRDESAMIDGFISKDPNKNLSLTIDSLNLDILNSFLKEKISGLINGEVQVRDLYNEPFIQNKLTIRKLTVDDFLVGNVSSFNQWNREEKRFDLNLSLDREGKKTVEMEGFYDPQKEIPLNMKAKLENTNIKIIEPFMRGIFSKMDGALTGNYTITGTFLEPIVQGNGKIQAASMVIDYLNTKYYFSGSLGFTPTQILFTDFNLTDELKNQASVNGFLAHRNYNDFQINLNSSFKNFQLLNTTSKDNNLFYGLAYGSGSLAMQGPVENLKILVTARSNKGTRIFIPLNGGADNTAKKDFITFVKFSDTLKLKRNAQKLKVKNEASGITMDMNLDITPDAYAEIIFDIKSGDIIRGYGNGNLKLQLDTKGEFSMFGAYEFDRGNYNFTLYDIINKEFTINKGSRITWLGDPYGATLALTASYKQLVSMGPVILNQTLANTLPMRRKYPVEVLLKLDGAMMAPQINFDIIANDLPNNIQIDAQNSVQLNFEFKAFKAKMDEQELKKQVFSLIMLRRFAPQDAFATGGNSSLYSSVSELLSNQLSYWLTQVDQNLEINFDLGNFDQEAFNTFQLRLSYSFLNGRLRVTRDGAFNNQYNRTDVSNMLGDWTVDYLLTPDGKFKVKMYNRTNVNQLASSLSIGQTAITTGFSLMNTQSFNTWKQLLTAARERRRKEKEEKPKGDQEDGTK